jgi:biopolymer transport protein ExbD
VAANLDSLSSLSSLSDDETFSSINVTPLVDVVLVLLIIFMITAPAIYQSAIQVQLPKAKTGETTGKKSPLNFTIDTSGKLMWGKDAVSWDELPARLSALGPSITDQTAMISADAATPHGTVIRLMDALRQVGLTHFGLSVEK